MARFGVTLWALVIVMVGGVPTAGLAEAVQVPAVAGETVISGAATAPVRVRVDREAVIDLSPVADADGALRPAAFDARAGDGFVGVMLTEPNTTSGLFVMAARLPEPLVDGSDASSAVGHGQPAVAHREPGGPLPSGPPTCVRCVVPAGEYDLYLIADRGETVVALTFEGLTGTTSVAVPRDRHLAAFTAWRTFEPNAGTVGGAGMREWFWAGSDEPEPGVLLDVREVSVRPGSLSAPVATVEHCRSAGGDGVCAIEPGHGAQIRRAIVNVMPGEMADDGIAVSTQVNTVGASSIHLKQGFVWLPLHHYIPSVGAGTGHLTDHDITLSAR